MTYTGELRVGAVYQSRAVPNIRRRITSNRDFVIGYTFIDERRSFHRTCFMLEDMFRSLTSEEIPPEEL